MKAYVKLYGGQIQWTYFLIKNYDLLDKYNIKEFESKPVYKKQFLKTRVKSYGNEATDLHDNEIYKVGSDGTCSAIINIDSALKKDEKLHPPAFLKECKCIEKEAIKHINEKYKFYLETLMESRLKVHILLCFSEYFEITEKF